MNNNDTKISYEKGIEELENIIDELEKNELSLEESIENFQKGIVLYKKLSQTLNEAEGKIKIILEDNNTDLKELDFEKKA